MLKLLKYAKYMEIIQEVVEIVENLKVGATGAEIRPTYKGKSFTINIKRTK